MLTLLELAERELALARAGEWEALAAAAEDRARRLETLRPTREELLAASAVQAELVALLAAARAQAARELAHLHRGRGAARAYGASSTSAPSGR
jgi:hypothetical protein